MHTLVKTTIALAACALSASVSSKADELGQCPGADKVETERAIVAAMKSGKTMSVKGISQRGTETADTYSLAGFTAALGAIDSACK